MIKTIESKIIPAPIRIALAGNPNCGKSTLFNLITGGKQYVGNWAGVTLEKHEGRLKGDKNVHIIDLPGVYSLYPHSPEELVVKEYLNGDGEKPDVILNIIDGTNIERNLFLTTELLETGIPIVVAINMIDIVKKEKISIDTQKLSTKLGCPVLEISAALSVGVENAISKSIELASGFNKAPKSINKLLRKQRYSIISEMLKECVFYKNNSLFALSDKIDRIVTNPFLSLPILVAVMFSVYFISVTLVGGFLTNWVKNGFFGEGFYLFGGLSPLNGKIWIPGVPVIAKEALTNLGAEEWLIRLITEGIISGVCGVLSFLPQIFVLFFLLAFLEGSGYLSRMAFILNDLFKKIGLSGRAFIPIILSTGCGVIGVLATRAVKNDKERRLTIMLTSFIPCGAKLPMIALFSAYIFDGIWWIAPFSYFLGVFAIILSGIILKRTSFFTGTNLPFIIELPPYRFPKINYLWKNTSERTLSFVKKAGTVILLFSVLIWIASNVGYYNGDFFITENLKYGILARFGEVVSPIFIPLGFGNWESTVAALTGIAAKENIVGSLHVLLRSHENQNFLSAHFTVESGLSFLVFNLLAPPCVAAISSIYREMNSFKWTLAALGYQTLFSYAVAFCFYQIALIIRKEVFMLNFLYLNLSTIIISVILLFVIFLIIKSIIKNRKKGGCHGCSGCSHNDSCSKLDK